MQSTNSNLAKTIISKEEAAKRGLSFYSTGKPCKNGHVSRRYITNRQCVECNRTQSQKLEAQKSKDDPSYRMYRNVHRRSGQALSGLYSPSRAVGCAHGKLRTHIENQFTVGMTWDNYRQWEVDHIIPLSAANSQDNIIQLCHYKNLQPLWKRENRMKGGA